MAENEADFASIPSEAPFEEISTYSEGRSSAAQGGNDWIRGSRNRRRHSVISVIMEESSEESNSSTSTYYSAFHTMA